MDIVVKEVHPKFQHSSKLGIEPGTFWLAVRDLTNCTCASLVQTTVLLGIQQLLPMSFMASYFSSGIIRQQKKGFK